MGKIAILFSGHLRNIHEIIPNLKNNLLDVIANKYEYDIYMHTWDNNITNDENLCQDKYFIENVVDVIKLFKNNGINIKKISIENQEDIKKNLNINDYLQNNCKNKTINGNNDMRYVVDITNKLFWQYYGHYKTLELVRENKDEYEYILKTRPDMYYDFFDLNLLNNKTKIFFPNSHQHGGCNINQMFFGGNTQDMFKILEYFEQIIYKNKNMNYKFLKENHHSNINFNQLFRFYIVEYLRIKPHFCTYNPQIYRNKNKRIMVR